jgi:hypothetical protein
MDFEGVVQSLTPFLNAIGIVGGLWFTAVSLRGETKARRFANLLTLTQHHREIWSELLERPALARVLNSDAELTATPVTEEEGIFVNLLVLYMNSVYAATRAGLFKAPEGAAQDVRDLLSRPIPAAIWKEIRGLQDKGFVAFIEGSLAPKSQRKKFRWGWGNPHSPR